MYFKKNITLIILSYLCINIAVCKAFHQDHDDEEDTENPKESQDSKPDVGK